MYHYHWDYTNVSSSLERYPDFRGPVDYLYVYIYSWECYGEHEHHWDYANVSSPLERLSLFQCLLIICMCA